MSFAYRTLLGLIVSLMAAATCVAQNSSPASEIATRFPSLLTEVTIVAKAMSEDDYGKIVDLTYPKIVEASGGKNRMIDFLKAETSEMKSEGLKFEQFTVGEIKQVAVVGTQVFAVVPMKMRIKTKQGKAEAASSLIGISEDGGKSWTFINGFDQVRFERLFPQATGLLVIPADEPAQLIGKD